MFWKILIHTIVTNLLRNVPHTLSRSFSYISKHISQRIGNASIEWLMIRGPATIKKEEKMIGGLD